MRQVASLPLWIGNAGDARRPADLIAQGIEAVVDLAANEPIALLPRDFVYLRFPLHDGASNDSRILVSAVAAVAELLRQKVPTLIACSAGMSRSPAIAAAALSQLTGRDPNLCLNECVASGPADVSPMLWSDLVNMLRAKTLHS